MYLLQVVFNRYKNIFLICQKCQNFLSYWFVRFFLVFLLCMYVANIFIKFVVYCCINKGIKGFKIFPFIKVDEPWHGGYLYYSVVVSAHYYLIYLYSSEIYDEVREYFLQKNINIDYIKKDYTVLF